MARDRHTIVWDYAWAQGFSQGQRTCAREMLRELIIQRFGGVDLPLSRSIGWETDVTALTAAALQVYHVPTPEDLRAVAGPGEPPRARPQLTPTEVLVGGPILDILSELGWNTGYLEGELAIARQLLRQLLADRFGTIPEADVQRIDSAKDAKLLKRAVLQAYCIAAPKYLLL